MFPYLITQVDSAYSLFKIDYWRRVIGERSAPVFGDIDGDGKYELILGCAQGGLRLFKQHTPVAIPSEQKKYEQVTIVSFTLTPQMRWHMYAGKNLSGNQHAMLDIQHLALGVYICIVSSGSERKTGRLVIV